MILELKKIEATLSLSPTQKILLATDGSITKILEAIAGGEIKVETVKQEVIKANAGIAKILGVATGDEINYRVVNLKSSKNVLVRAISYAPLKRLKKNFKEDIMKADVPIGKIMSKLKIEARREINLISTVKAEKELVKIFGLKPGAILLKRNYNIIHNNEILLNITELFPHEKFR